VTSGSINIFKGNLERLRQPKEIDLFVGLLMLLDLLRLSRAVGEASSGKLSGKLTLAAAQTAQGKYTSLV